MLDRRAVVSGLALAMAPSLGRAEAPESFSATGRYLPYVRGQLANDDAAPIWLAFTGDEVAAFARRPVQPSGAMDTPDLTGARSEDAIDAIARAARGRRVVILNEAHHVSRDRAFALTVALRLRQEGFGWFAAEGFAEKLRLRPSPALLAQSPVQPAPAVGAPVTDETGVYLPDPVFAELVRGVHEAGMRLFAYERRKAQRKPAPIPDFGADPAREQAQAENLAWLLQQQPRARIFVYCGYGHACKTPPDGVVRMAARLQSLTGLDPLSVDQSAGAPGPERRLEEPALTAVLDRLRLRRSACVTLADGSPLILRKSYRGGFDLGVVHPRLPYVKGRPGWLAAAPGRRLATVRLPNGAPVGALVQAVPAEELALSPAAIPADLYPLALGAGEAVFFLRRGAYVVRVEAPEGFTPVGVLRVG
jgi:hypothetical protein